MLPGSAEALPVACPPGLLKGQGKSVLEHLCPPKYVLQPHTLQYLPCAGMLQEEIHGKH